MTIADRFCGTFVKKDSPKKIDKSGNFPDFFIVKIQLERRSGNPVFIIGTAKHYAVHSGPESLRHEFNARVSERDFRETYIPAFRTFVVEEERLFGYAARYRTIE